MGGNEPAGAGRGERLVRSLEATVQDLSDRQEIANTLYQYCRGMDLLDMDLIAGAFTEDGLLDIGPEPRLQTRGAGAIHEAMKRMKRFTRSSHHLSNIQIEFHDKDRAGCVSYIMAWHETADGHSGTMMGQFHDEFVRTPAGWRIHKRQLRMSGNDAGFQLNVHKAARNQI
jgi:SnoaL-like domain